MAFACSVAPLLDSVEKGRERWRAAFLCYSCEEGSGELEVAALLKAKNGCADLLCCEGNMREREKNSNSEEAR
jgi:hypothetical protein